MLVRAVGSAERDDAGFRGDGLHQASNEGAEPVGHRAVFHGDEQPMVVQQGVEQLAVHRLQEATVHHGDI